MVLTRSCVEKSRVQGNECVVEIRFEGAVAVGVHDAESVRYSERDMIRGQTYDWTYDVRSVARPLLTES